MDMQGEYWFFPGAEQRYGRSAPERREFLRVPVQTSTKHVLPVTIRILPYPFYSFVRHSYLKAGKMRYMVCSAKKFDGKCVGCYYQDNKNIIKGTKTFFALTVLALNKVHVIELEDGSIRYERCEKNLGSERFCDKCASGNKPRILGRRYWTVGPGYFGILREKNLELASKCVNCGSYITLKSLQCPSCRADLIPVDRLNAMSTIDQTRQASLTWTCPRCRNTASPKELIQVLECSCGNPVRGSIFKCDLDVSVYQPSPERGGYRMLMIKEHNFSEIPEEYQEYIKPYDFEEILAPLSLDQQAALLEVRNPYAPVSAPTVPYQEEIKREVGKVTEGVARSEEDSLDVFND